ncbi:hypothetical protein ON05_004435 [Acaryochloris sp. CCMEE 5410]|nr:hypothetical protein ON05_004435 [Acaryochloris sp. CCMEE 5410]
MPSPSAVDAGFTPPIFQRPLTSQSADLGEDTCLFSKKRFMGNPLLYKNNTIPCINTESTIQYSRLPHHSY